MGTLDGLLPNHLEVDRAAVEVLLETLKSIALPGGLADVVDRRRYPVLGTSIQLQLGWTGQCRVFGGDFVNASTHQIS